MYTTNYKDTTILINICLTRVLVLVNADNKNIPLLKQRKFHVNSTCIKHSKIKSLVQAGQNLHCKDKIINKMKIIQKKQLLQKGTKNVI